MSGLIIPKNYTPFIDYMESQRAIKKIKDFFHILKYITSEDEQPEGCSSSICR